jgi:hypothetical protein
MEKLCGKNAHSIDSVCISLVFFEWRLINRLVSISIMSTKVANKNNRWQI